MQLPGTLVFLKGKQQAKGLAVGEAFEVPQLVTTRHTTVIRVPQGKVGKLLPEDHLLGLIDRHVNFEFIRANLKDSYSDTGRPSIDPELLLRMLLVGYLYGVTSERKLVGRVTHASGVALVHRTFPR